VGGELVGGTEAEKAVRRLTDRLERSVYLRRGEKGGGVKMRARKERLSSQVSRVQLSIEG